MRVLMTGFTSLQINTERRTIQKIDVPASIVDALRLTGHTVDWRKVSPGEDLSGYDVAWVNLSALNSLNGRAGAMGALWTLASGLPTVGYFDDWQFGIVFNGARALVRKPEMLTKYMLVGSEHRGEEMATYYDRDEAYAAYARICEENPEAERRCYVERYFMYDTDEGVLPYRDTLLSAAEALVNDRWSFGMVPVCPMYGWGEREKVTSRMPSGVGRIEALDPSPTIYTTIGHHNPLPPDEKKFAWILGALTPQDAWIDRKSHSWPVEYLGSRKMQRTRGGDRVQSESDVVARYNGHWGILSPPYPHAGCGWWRSRFIYSARVKSILVCDKGEGDPLGKPYTYSMPDVEAMNVDSLAQLAEDQAAALRPWMPHPDTFVKHVNDIVYRAIHEDKGWRPESYLRERGMFVLSKALEDLRAMGAVALLGQEERYLIDPEAVLVDADPAYEPPVREEPPFLEPPTSDQAPVPGPETPHVENPPEPEPEKPVRAKAAGRPPKQRTAAPEPITVLPPGKLPVMEPAPQLEVIPTLPATWPLQEVRQ